MNRRHQVAATLTAATALLAACSANTSDEAATTTATTGASTSNKTSGEQLTLTDVKGRTVVLDHAPERIILGEGRGVFATSILDNKNPLDHVVAMGSDLKAAAPSYYDKFMDAVPAAKDIPTIGNMGKGDVTVENLLSHQPDLVIMSADHYDASQGNGLLDKLDTAKIPYVVTDFRQHPMENTTKSVELLGKIWNKQDRAADFTNTWNTKVEKVKELVKDEEATPTFLWRAAGLKDCCNTINNSNLGEFVNAAGGDNLGDHLLDAESGTVTAEKLIEKQPQVIIATGGSWAPDKDKPQAIPHANLGYDTDAADATSTLAGLVATPGLDQVTATQNGNLYSVWHQFYDSPLNYIALMQFARWLHPEATQELDVEKEWKDAHSKYVAFPVSGTFFAQDKK